MRESKSNLLVYDHPSKTFIGVRFLLFCFDPILKDKVRSKLVNGGGVDVGQYGPNCTHVIVNQLVYDDPMCVAARNDGKILVTSLWVDHSFDVGMPVDPNHIMYIPLRDLNGIPGSKDLIVCLTGYQRHDRDDIMTMVGLMGANFSKPLVANKVTHLICYKFEGEKYELAKKMKKIKLINHRWLEDCLRTWEILSEANYDKSGYELEMMEAEAKDSDEEADEMTTKEREQRKIFASPHNVQMEMSSPCNADKSKQEISRNLLNLSASPHDLSNVGLTINMASGTGKEMKSDQVLYLHKIHNEHPEVLGSRGTITPRGVSCGEPSDPWDGIAIAANGGNDLASTFGSETKSPHSDTTKLSAISYSRITPRKTTPSIYSREKVESLSNSFAVNTGKLYVSDVNISASMIEQNGTVIGCGKIPLEGTELCAEEGQNTTLPEKRKINISSRSSKSQKIILNPANTSEGSLLANSSGRFEAASSTDDTLEIPNRLFVGNNTHGVESIGEDAALDPAKYSPKISRRASLTLDRMSLTCDRHRPTSSTVSSEMRKDGTVEDSLQASIMEFKKTSLASNSDTKDAGVSRVELPQGEIGKSQKEQHNIEVPSPTTKSSEATESNSPANMDLLKGGIDSHSKTLRRKTLAKKSLGSRPIGRNTTNQKGSIYLNKPAPKNDDVASLVGEKEMADHVTAAPEDETVLIDIETNHFRNSGNKTNDKTVFMDDETEAPEDKEEIDSKAAASEEKSKGVEPAHAVDMVTAEKSEGGNHVTNETVGNTFGMNEHAIASGKHKNEIETEKPVFDKQIELGESACMENSGKENVTKGKKQPSSKPKKKTLVRKVENSIECSDGKGANCEKNSTKTKKKEESIPPAACKTKRTAPVNKSEKSNEAEKENRLTSIGDQSVSHGKQRVEKMTSKSDKTIMTSDIKVGGMGSDSKQMEGIVEVKIETVWFILSGHKLQKKEFQQVIRRLKGRVCRNSHQWSYQATHFIVPDPIRRTEKFFAAAASGRWILKTDYLTASNQAGRFLAEEPFEWHKNELSEDGAINLQAPRKWRLLRERTGHGAFYGMRIIIYGDCIAPPLDTLKRVLKAGDGTILATSPPYSRFLQSGVDFAIVSPGMPRVDVWIQEFLRHEIPCVFADYLVEYVCKPGYSLDRHVQFNTHAWAEKSFNNLVNRMEEIVEDLKTPEDDGYNDLPCEVCGSRGRGDVMLICGNESGSSGCGVGTHIDCCDPPLEDVPEEDWFCPNCSRSNNPPKSMKKRSSVSKK